VFKLFMQDERGGISAEYVAILALVVIASMTALTNLGDAIGTVVGNVQTRLTNSLTPATPAP
jgi:Flp pilus assembly pilin Flp